MNTKIKFLLMGIVTLTISLLFAKNSHAIIVRQDTTSITGIVTPVEWYEEDNVIEVAISVTIAPEDSTEEVYTEDYLVGDTEKDNELLQLLGTQRGGMEVST